MFLKVAFLLFSSHWTILSCETNLKLLVITETRAEGVPQHLSEGIELAERKYSGKIKLDMNVVPLLRDNENESFRHVCAKGSEGIGAILDLTWSGWDKMNSLAEASNIPILKVDVSIRPFVKALNDFVTFRNGTDSALIFETEEELDQALYYLIGHSILRVVVIEKLSPKNVKGLADMRPTASFHSIFASTKEVQDMFKKAQEGDLIKRDGRWNLLFTDFKYEAFNLTGVKVLINLLTMKKEICCALQNLDDKCICPNDFQLIPRFLLNVGSLLGDVLFDLLSENAKLMNKIDCSLKETSLDNFKKGTAAKFTNVLSKHLSRQNVIFYDSSDNLVYYKSKMDVFVANASQKTQLGAWNSEEGFELHPGQHLEPDKRFFRIGIVPEDEPWSYQEIDEKSGELVWTGYCVDLAYKLAEVMNFDFEFKIPASGKFGKKTSKGRWDGVIGDLTRGETDIIIVSLIMTSEREEVVDFVAPYYHQSGISIVIRKPVRHTSLFKFMTVLRVEVWVSIVGALTVTGVMIWFLDKYSPYSARNNKEMYPYPCREFTLKESFWFALTSFTPQGGGEAPKALSGRTLVAAYWLFVVLMLATFTANLAAFLTVERMKSPVESLEQLARQSRINYTVVRNGEAHKFFINMKKAEDTLYRAWKELALNASSEETQYRVWDYPIKEQYGHILLAIEQTGLVDNESVGFQKVLDSEKGEFAFIHDEATIKYRVYKNCNFTEVGDIFAERPYAIAVQQGSQLQEEISRKILNLQKERYFEGRAAKYWNSTVSGNCPNTDDSEGITLGSLGGVFIATLFGLALAMITLAGEILYHKHKNAVDQKINKIKPGKKVDTIDYPPYISRIPHATRVNLDKKLMPSYRPTGPGKMMPRVSYISVFPRNPPIYD